MSELTVKTYFLISNNKCSFATYSKLSIKFGGFLELYHQRLYLYYLTIRFTSSSFRWFLGLFQFICDEKWLTLCRSCQSVNILFCILMLKFRELSGMSWWLANGNTHLPGIHIYIIMRTPDCCLILIPLNQSKPVLLLFNDCVGPFG